MSCAWMLQTCLDPIECNGGGSRILNRWKKKQLEVMEVMKVMEVTVVPAPVVMMMEFRVEVQ